MTVDIARSFAEIPRDAEVIYRIAFAEMTRAMGDPSIGTEMALSIGFSAIIREYLRAYGTSATIATLDAYAKKIEENAATQSQPVGNSVTIPDLGYRLSDAAARLYLRVVQIIGDGMRDREVGLDLTFSMIFSTMINLMITKAGAATTAAILHQFAETTAMVAKMNAAATFPEGHA